MQVTQSISIGHFRLNTISNSSVIQVGVCGSIESHSRSDEQLTQTSQTDAEHQEQLSGKKWEVDHTPPLSLPPTILEP